MEMSITQLMIAYAQQQARKWGLSDLEAQGLEAQGFVRELKRTYSANFNAETAKGWEPIQHSFADGFVDDNNQRHNLQVTLSIIPIRHGEEQLAVASNSRAQIHACNLARTSAINIRTGQEYFSGVRHGILDAFDISKNGGDLQLLNANEQLELLADAEENCTKIVDSKWAPIRSRYRKAIIKNPEKLYFQTRVGRNILRWAASLNMAKELVQEAVLSSAVNQDEIKNRSGKHMLNPESSQEANVLPLSIVLNSIALVTPDVLRQASNLFKGRAHKTERNHLSY